MPKRPVKQTLTALSALLLLGTAAVPMQAHAQLGRAAEQKDLKLAEDSPYRDPDIVYLEADELTNDEANGILTANGEVEGRYEDKTLRAERVIYYLDTGRIIASGNVVLVQADGSSQYADKLELSGELEAGTASNFVARTPDGGLTAARFVARNSDEEIELYNAYYTACEVCEGSEDKPSWRLKARRVQQDKDTRTVRYRDATLELFGFPVLYTPYFAHPDPTVDRASGFLIPFMGLSQSKGFNVRTPYYWAIDDYTEATITPRVFSNVNPVLGYQIGRKFNTGKIIIDGSFTYGSVFDRDGDPFDDATRFINPEDAPIGKRWRSHIYADGLFAPNDTWTYGFGLQLSTDDTYINRYDFDERRETNGLYSGESRRNTSQAYLIGQDNNDDFRFAVSTVGFQDLRTSFRQVNSGSDDLLQVVRQDDSELPIIAPKIEVEKTFTDPALGGRLRLFGDTTILTRKIGSNYTRATGGADWSKTWIAPGGIEVKPFAMGRVDYYDLEADDSDAAATTPALKRDFTRTLGQVGTDIRYPFIKQSGNTTWILEPRAQITQNFGNAKLDSFTNATGVTETSLSEDLGFTELNPLLFWQANKSTGYDFWQEGGRADIGGAASVRWGRDNSAEVFAGRSLAWDIDDDFRTGSGLETNSSDYVGQLNVKLGRSLQWRNRASYDANNDRVRRIESQLRTSSKYLDLSARYYRINNDNLDVSTDPFAPPEEISGRAKLKLTKNWSVGYSAYHDIDANLTRRQSVSLGYRDDCTLIELAYTENNFGSDVVRDSAGFNLRIALLTLGDFSGD